jgi:DNA modification methylase
MLAGMKDNNTNRNSTGPNNSAIGQAADWVTSGFLNDQKTETSIGRIVIRDRIRELRRVPAKELLTNPKNWRVHPRAQSKAMRALLEKVGYAGALLARELPDGRLMLIDGHLRKDTTPNALVPVLIVDVTEEEADLILATFDPLGTLARPDPERIKTLLETVQTDSAMIQELLRDTAGDKIWEMVHPNKVAQVEVSSERADELRAKWGTEKGQLWKAGEHTIICGDSQEKAVIAKLWRDSGRPLRMIWCDPPFGVNYGEKTDWTYQHGGGSKRRPIENDSLKPAELQLLFANALDAAKHQALPGAVVYATVPSVFLKYFIQGLEDAGFSYKHCLIWLKQTFVLSRGDYHYRHEPILYGWLENGPHFFSGDRTHDSVFEIDRPMTSELHPTTKPTELIAKMIANSSRPGEIVYDPFAGSGSTLVAAHQLGRIGYGCEIDPGYIAVVLERLSLLGLKPEISGK